MDMVKVFLLLYADDIVIFFSNTAEELQSGSDILSVYCKSWKLSINVSKTKVIILGGGILSRNLSLTYDGQPLKIVKSFKYLGVVFTTGGSFSEAQTILAGQAQKAIFKLNSYLYNFTSISPKHKLDLFDKLITPIPNYSCEVWGFIQANAIESVHLQFCKKTFGVKKVYTK